MPFNSFDSNSVDIGGVSQRYPNATAVLFAVLLLSTLPREAVSATVNPNSSSSPELCWLALLNCSDFAEGNFTIHGQQSNLSSDPYPPWDLCDRDTVDFQCTVQQYLEYARGPQQMPLTTALLVTILFVGILVTGVVGNVIVCLVIIRHPSMRTATNYYLFSLAVSDLILLVLGLPYEISLYWHQYPYNMGLVFCKIRALLSEASTYVSVLTIVAFSMERFLAICHPLHLYTMSGLQRPVRIIAGLWIVSLFSAVPFAVFTDIDYIVYPPTGEKILDSAFCAMLSNPEGIPLWELSTCLFFVIPMVVMVVLYGRMGLQIRSRTQRTEELGVRNGSVNGPSRVSQSRKAIIRMLAAVVITFFICWAPFHAQRLLFLYGRDWQHFTAVNVWLFWVAGWLYYVSCTINPILYNVMSHRYRVAFRETLCGRRRGLGPSFIRDQSSFRETTLDVGGGSENSKLLRARSMMQSKLARHKSTLHANNSIRYNSNCIRRNSLQIGHLPSNRSSLSPSNTTADMVVKLENNLTGRARCYTTPVTTSVTTPESVSATTAPATEHTQMIPLININGVSDCMANADSVNNVNNISNHVSNNNNNNNISINDNIEHRTNKDRDNSPASPSLTFSGSDPKQSAESLQS
ncbi:neuropeptides capa receptor [Malaya genurostris]|uniref:neuropeptides capa receptor n=1 Tax=Malaya genurostris TaxID=325434 RepID=UPI0026F3BB66|nr:neuropeptides capa receptor [Malaya genurostris]XP_058455082.1 neuropeptides capa receptor [Malaya genurostris]XP_058455083.1 neuropeptides capa receptor [Malaya genurostris]XP_058455086.1 neuropeptides capa receptor [Malaya genurostris]XP_058455087.1 neuropeptides capa receptor [Malaya genurostris]XP_058455088.1 neuropeptides capa receptor [Malaya genurostris]XP_058455089.1 neuropeptides capa receptor [Malaya genurostris]